MYRWWATLIFPILLFALSCNKGKKNKSEFTLRPADSVENSSNGVDGRDQIIGKYAGSTHIYSVLAYSTPNPPSVDTTDTTFLDTIVVIKILPDSIGIDSSLYEMRKFRYDSSGVYNFVYTGSGEGTFYTAQFVGDSLLVEHRYGVAHTGVNFSSKKTFNGKKL